MTTLSQRVAAARAAKAAALNPAVEDLDPTAVGQGPTPVQMIEPNVVPSTDNVKALSETYQELEAKAEDEASKDMEEDKDDLTDVRDELDADNAEGGISAESLAFAMLATRYHSKRLGIESFVGIPSMESAISEAGRGKVVVSTESLTASLEGVDKPMREFAKRAASTFYRLIAPLWATVKIAGMGLEGLAKKANNLKPVPDAKIKIGASLIGVGDGPSKNLAADLQKAAVVISFMTKKFTKEAKDAYEHNLEVTDKILKGKEEPNQIEKAMEEILAKWEDPRKKLGDRAADPLIGNYKLFEDHSLKYKGDNPTAKKFDELANLNYPSLVGFQDHLSENDQVTHEVELAALTPQQISQIALALKSAVRDFSFWREQVEKLLASSTVAAASNPLLLVIKLSRRSGQLAKKPGEGHLAEDIRTVYDALVTSGRLRFHTGYDAGRVLKRVIYLFKKIAKLSLKAHAAAATEAFDTAKELEGETTNDVSPIEPEQTPDQTAPTGEVLPKQSSFQDNPESKQDLSGPVGMRRPSTESADGVLTGKAPTGAESALLKTVKDPGEGDKVKEVKSPKVDTAGSAETSPKQKTIEDSAALTQNKDGPVNTGKAKSEAKQTEKDNEICVDLVGDGSTKGGPTGLESFKGKPKVKVPYWYKKK